MPDIFGRARQPLPLAAALVIVSGGLPLLLAWVCVWSAPTLSTRDALARLTDPSANAVLVDVRPHAWYVTGHLAGAIHWSDSDIRALASADAVPPALQGRLLLLLSDDGTASARAAQHLAVVGVAGARNIEGGLQAWIGDASSAAPAPYAVWQTASGERGPLPFRPSSGTEQLAVFLGGFVFKTAYMLLALLLVVWLGWPREPEFVALSFGLSAFFVAEFLCWVNFPLGRAESAMLEYGHSFGMVMCLAGLTFAMVEGTDQRLVHFGDRQARCALLPLCRACIKYKAAPCGLMHLFRIAIPALAVVALMPFSVTPSPDSYNTRVAGMVVNFSHQVLNQLYESRVAPLAALVLLGAAWANVAFARHGDLRTPKILLAAGVGHLAFALMRVTLYSFYRDNLVWFAFWEETTELILIAGIGIVLWTFRRGLGMRVPWPLLAAPRT